MRSKFFARALLSLVAALCWLSFSPAQTFAQEGEALIVDEVIAQVNNDVVTLSMLKREMRERIDALKQNGVPEQQATEEVTKRQPELIITMINEQLLLQKGKDLNLSDDVEAEVNRRMLEVAKEQNIKTIEELDEAMRKSGYNMSEVRQSMRTEMMKSAVMQRDVDAKIFFGLSADELKKYYDAHQDKFKKAESVTLSEIFLSLAGKNEAEVKARAAQLVAEARGGKDFGALAVANSEREIDGVRVAPQNKGKVGAFEVPNLRADLATSIKGLKAGGVTDPIRTDEGYQILRVDERTAGSDTSTFNENQVREAMTIERAPKERETYLKTLRDDAYIKIAEGYRPTIEPLLKKSAPATASATTPASKSDNKKSDSKKSDAKKHN
ncbi:MAG: peptidyl-prolyl cis-trans isomerase SurA [Blastocatellia bacterium]|nr:peptidyl-prolyl cis-trans isomerase SurA [Blastocatellia bacterium]